MWRLLFVVALMCWQGVAVACGNVFFSPDDYANEKPLKAPDKAFKQMLKRAQAGDPHAQRSLAVSYESGYLTSVCDEKAVHWYVKAARGKDEIAINWVKQRIDAEIAMAGPAYLDLFGASRESRLVACESVIVSGNTYYQYGKEGCVVKLEKEKPKEVTLADKKSDTLASLPPLPTPTLRPRLNTEAMNVLNTAGAVNVLTGEFLTRAGPNLIGTRDGTLYVPAGPNGYIDTRTGRFAPAF